MVVTGGVAINWDEVPEVNQTILCRSFIEGAERLYDLLQKNPVLNAEFEAWRKARYE